MPAFPVPREAGSSLLQRIRHRICETVPLAGVSTALPQPTECASFNAFGLCHTSSVQPRLWPSRTVPARMVRRPICRCSLFQCRLRGRLPTTGCNRLCLYRNQNRLSCRNRRTGTCVSGNSRRLPKISLLWNHCFWGDSYRYPRFWWMMRSATI